MSSKLIHIFWNADLRGRQPALTKIAKKEIDVEDLNPGDLIFFINRKRDKIAVLAGCREEETLGILGYYCSPRGRIDEMALRFIPEGFGASGRIDMTEATRKAILDRLRKKGREYRNENVIVRRGGSHRQSEMRV